MSGSHSEYDRFIVVDRSPRTLRCAAARFDGITETLNVIRFLCAVAAVHEMRTGDAMCISKGTERTVRCPSDDAMHI